MISPDPKEKRAVTIAALSGLEATFNELHEEAFRRSANNTFTIAFAAEVTDKLTGLNRSLSEIRREFEPLMVRELLGNRFIGPDQIRKALHVKDFGEIPALPEGLLGILQRDSLITPGKKVYEDHIFVYIPASFDGTANSVLTLKALVQRAEAKRLKRDPEAKPVFDKTSDWYFEENWAKAATPTGKWILTPDTVPADTRGITFEAQSKLIAEKYLPYLRGEAPELISLLSLTELSSKERLYPWDTWGWTETETDLAGAYPGQRVRVGGFDVDGFWVDNLHPVIGRSWLGAFLCWNFRD